MQNFLNESFLSTVFICPHSHWIPTRHSSVSLKLLLPRAPVPSTWLDPLAHPWPSSPLTSQIDSVMSPCGCRLFTWLLGHSALWFSPIPLVTSYSQLPVFFPLWPLIVELLQALPLIHYFSDYICFLDDLIFKYHLYSDDCHIFLSNETSLLSPSYLCPPPTWDVWEASQTQSSKLTMSSL